MIVECSRRPDGWIPVKGNEKEICEFLLEQNYYEEYSIDKDGNDFDFDVDNELWKGVYFNDQDGYFIKLNDDGSIHVPQGQPSFKDYVAMEFNLTGDFDWVKWLFKAPNIHSLYHNTKGWDIDPTPFQMQEGDILVFDKNSRQLHNVLNRTSVTIDDVLLENGYVVCGNSINQEIWALEKRLQERITLDERMSIISRIRSLRNGEG